MPRILVVEDESQMKIGLKKALEFEGHAVEVAADGQEGLDLILENQYHLVILDVMLPLLSGFDVCRKVREQGKSTPIIMLTAKGEEIDKVLGLELGADDYMTKPFSLRELLARVKAILRRAPGPEQLAATQIHIGKLEINLQNYAATSGEQKIAMTHREIEVLKYLWEHQNQTVSRDELLNKIWGIEEIVTPRTIDNFILKLRHKIEENPTFPRHILTVHKIGYKLIP